MKCSKCGERVDACDNVECINNCQNSKSLSKEYTIFCNDGHHHYCEIECLVEEFRSCAIKGEEAELIDDDETPKPKKVSDK
jgi:hypothetical protein